MQKTLVLIKPDALQRGLANTILSRLEKLGLRLAALRMLQMDEALAERHYAIHRDKPFFKDLVEYITSEPVVAAVFEGEDTVERTRNAMGATDPAKADAGTIRGDFGISIVKNSVHGSDSAATAEHEVRLFFSPDQIF
jgi:nucleoside-diphosphate kinase